jgi:hypothetical protein
MAAKSERRPPVWRFILQIALIIVAVAVGAMAFQQWLSTEARLERLLEREAQAADAGDIKAFFGLQDPTDAAWWAQQQDAITSRATAIKQGAAATGEPRPPMRVTGIEVKGDTARAIVETEWGDESVHLVSFFRQADEGWLHTGPRAEFWGEPRQAGSEHLTWLYRERDEEWVGALLDDGEAMLRQLDEELGISPTEPITIEVRYRPPYWQEVKSTSPVLALPSLLLAGGSEHGTRSAVGRVLAQYVCLNYAGYQSVGQALQDSRGVLLTDIISWEGAQVTGSGLDEQSARLGADAAAGNEPLSLDQVWAETGEPQALSSRLRMALAYTAIDYIAARHGRQAVRELLGGLRTVPTVDEALEKVLGYRDRHDLETGWLEFVRDRYGRME